MEVFPQLNALARWTINDQFRVLLRWDDRPGKAGLDDLGPFASRQQQPFASEFAGGGFSIALARVLENLKSDSSELRNAAYARIKLQKECWQVLTVYGRLPCQHI